MVEVVVTTGAISRAKLQSNHHHQQTNTKSFFTGRMPFLSPNQQCQSTEGKISHSMDFPTPVSPGGLPTLTLTIVSLSPIKQANPGSPGQNGHLNREKRNMHLISSVL